VHRQVLDAQRREMLIGNIAGRAAMPSMSLFSSMVMRA